MWLELVWGCNLGIFKLVHVLVGLKGLDTPFEFVLPKVLSFFIEVNSASQKALQPIKKSLQA